MKRKILEEMYYINYEYFYKTLSAILVGSSLATVFFGSPKSLLGNYNHIVAINSVNHFCIAIYRIT